MTTAHRAGAPAKSDDAGEPTNEVRLVGRLAADPQLRELPSGDTVWNLRVVVDRPVPPPVRYRASASTHSSAPCGPAG
jgi:hypothetical protein